MHRKRRVHPRETQELRTATWGEVGRRLTRRSPPAGAGRDRDGASAPTWAGLTPPGGA